MISDGTKFGMLVKFFPYEALNSIIYLSEDNVQEKLLYLLSQNMHLCPLTNFFTSSILPVVIFEFEPNDGDS